MQWHVLRVYLRFRGFEQCFLLSFFFVPFNQGCEEASVGFVVNGRVDKPQYLSNKYVRQARPRNGLRQYRTIDLGPYRRVWSALNATVCLLEHDFVAMLRTPSIAFRELKYPVKWGFSLQSHCKVIWTYLDMLWIRWSRIEKFAKKLPRTHSCFWVRSRLHRLKGAYSTTHLQKLPTPHTPQFFT